MWMLILESASWFSKVFLPAANITFHGFLRCFFPLLISLSMAFKIKFTFCFDILNSFGIALSMPVSSYCMLFFFPSVHAMIPFYFFVLTSVRLSSLIVHLFFQSLCDIHSVRLEISPDFKRFIPIISFYYYL